MKHYWKQITAGVLVVAVFFLFNPLKASASFSYSRSLTVQTGQVSGTQTNFPMLVYGFYAYLATVANGGKVQNANGYDIGFYSNSNCSSGKLNWEIEKYVATTGEIEAWVNVASITDGTVIYMCYGDASISTDQSNKTATWNGNYIGVYHLPDGTTLNTNDSTSAGANLSNTGGSTACGGQIDGCAFFNGTTQNLDGGSNFNFTSGDFTLYGWFYFSSLSTDQSGQGPVIFYKGAYQTGGYYMQVDGTGSALVGTNQIAAAQFTSASPVITTATWTQIVATRSGSTVTIYVNGVDQTNSHGTHSDPGTSLDTFKIGNYNDFIHTHGGADEIEISNSVRSTGWILTEYNNQSSAGTFYTVGSEVPLGNAALPVHRFVFAGNTRDTFTGIDKFIFN